ncbi:CD109 antigen-like [Xenopus laevis]|uniref:CD109 antigen-like n=1 Tax=Xenopus laevis TaxID=8355 RepID=A0A8J1KP13_XENLA|nr:CD109 antigen-like [Xenopus laevis]OCT58454.1 hypothetical protein XELAEV_18002126mg [Xenopus laevis]
MVLWEVPFLSGFELDPVGIGLNGSFKLVEIKDEKVFLYFDSMNRNEICVVVPMVRTSLVAGSQAAAIKIYDYYNPGIYTMRTYNSEKLNKVTVCAFCELNCNACISNVMMPMTSSTTIPPKNSLSTTTAKPLVSSATASTLAMLGFCVSCMWNLLWKLYLAYIFA